MSFRLLNGNLFARMFRGGAARLRSNSEEVNRMNVFPVPDGDTGDNMSMTMEGGVRALDGAESDDLSEVANSLSDGMLLGARGNSGVILSQFFAGIADGFAGCTTADVERIGQALLTGVKRAYAAVVTPTEGTILTVARESVEYAVARIDRSSTVESLFADLSAEADASVRRTPEALSVLKEAGVVDSGGCGLRYIVDGFLKILTDGEFEETALSSASPDHSAGSETDPQNNSVSADPSAPGPDFVPEYGYCTEILLQLTYAKCDPDTFDLPALIHELEALGDSIAAVRSGTLVKIHVHTREPDRVIALGLRFGELVKIKIENMSLQHRDELKIAKRTGSDGDKTAAAREAGCEWGVVSVAPGDGIEDLFRRMGSDGIVCGGQTMNPSTEDFLVEFDAVKARIGARKLLVFPNNGNVILAAKQAAALWKGGDVFVVESRSIGDGYAGLCAVDRELEDGNAQLNAVSEAMEQVVTGSMTVAVRDSEVGGMLVHEGEQIGICGKDILAADREMIPCALTFLEKIRARIVNSGCVDVDIDSLRVFVGENVNDADVTALTDAVEEAFPAADVCVLPGGQPVYPFIFVIG